MRHVFSNIDKRLYLLRSGITFLSILNSLISELALSEITHLYASGHIGGGCVAQVSKYTGARFDL